MKRKICCVFVTLVLITSNLVSAYASATPTVVVSGGTMATGGLASGYSAKSEAAAITLVMVMMRSLGMTVHLSQQAIAAGKTAYTVIRGKFREWAGETDGSSALQPEVEENLRDKFELINGGSSSDPDGKLYFTPAVAKLVQQFVNWLESRNDIGDSETSGSSPTIINGTYYGSKLVLTAGNGYVCEYAASTGDVAANVESSLTNVAWGSVYDRSASKYALFAYRPITEPTFYLFQKRQTATNYLRSARHDSYANYWYEVYSSSNILSSNVYFLTPPEGVYSIPNDNKTPEEQIEAYLRSLNGQWSSTSAAIPDGIVAPGGDVDTSQLDNPDDKPVVVDPGVLPQLNPQTDAQVGIGDYIELLKQMLNKETDPAIVPQPLPALDPAIDSPVSVPVPDSLPVAPPWTITLPSDQDAPQDIPTGNTPVTDPSEPAPPDVTIPEMSVKLEDYFPFCIPFDIYNLLSKFSAAPVTPEVHLSFDVPRMNISIPLDIDMSPFDGVASIARKMETVTYIVGLGMITRKTVLRG